MQKMSPTTEKKIVSTKPQNLEEKCTNPKENLKITNPTVKIQRIERRNSYKDGCSVIIFIVLIILSVLFVTFCISKYYTQEKRIKMLNCCRRRMIINSMISNLSEELANDMRVLFEIETELHNLPIPIPVINITDFNYTNIEPKYNVTVIDNSTFGEMTILPTMEEDNGPFPIDLIKSLNDPISYLEKLDKTFKNLFPKSKFEKIDIIPNITEA